VPNSTSQTVNINDLTSDAANVRKRDDRARSALSNSIKQFGPARSIVIDADDIVRAGNGTLEQAKAAGITKVRVIESDGSELIAVKRSDMTGSDAVAYAIADNRISDLSTFDDEALAQQLQAVATECSIEAIGFNDDELADMLSAITNDAEAAEPVRLDIGEVTYRVIVMVANEHQQAELITDLEQRGFECQPLMS